MVIKYQILGDLNNRKLFLTILEVEKSKMSAWLGSGDLPDQGIKPTSLVSPALQADSLPIEPSGKISTPFI